MNIIDDIISSTRRTGNSTWILKSAMNDNKCIIVYPSESIATLMKKLYKKMLKEKGVGEDLEFPKFLTLGDDFSNCKVPVIFDNSAIESEVKIKYKCQNRYAIVMGTHF